MHENPKILVVERIHDWSYLSSLEPNVLIFIEHLTIPIRRSLAHRKLGLIRAPLNSPIKAVEEASVLAINGVLQPKGYTVIERSVDCFFPLTELRFGCHGYPLFLEKIAK